MSSPRRAPDPTCPIAGSVTVLPPGMETMPTHPTHPRFRRLGAVTRGMSPRWAPARKAASKASPLLPGAEIRNRREFQKD